jgi:hypothetical protein
MEATCSYETSVDFQRTTQRYIQEHRTFHNHRCENLKSDPLPVFQFHDKDYTSFFFRPIEYSIFAPTYQVGPALCQLVIIDIPHIPRR